VLGHLEDQPALVTVDVEGVQDFGQLAREVNIDNRPHHLGDVADILCRHA